MKTKELEAIAQELYAQITPETPASWCGDTISVCEEVARHDGPELTIEEGDIVLDRLNKLVEESRTPLTLTFSVVGYVKQTIKITNPKWSKKKLIEALNAGTVLTTIQENGTVDVTATGEVVGKVINVENNCEYEDFANDDI